MSVILGTSGDDYLPGTAGDDVIDGGAGNDTLVGDLGSDTYVFGLGYGHDQIFNAEPESNFSPDRILLNPGVSPSDVDLKVVTRDAQGNAIPQSLLLTLRSSGETLLVHGNYELSPTGYLNASITSIEFADGTIWNWMEIEQRSHEIHGTSGDDILIGGDGDGVIYGEAGNDVLDGKEGWDSLIGGSGSDTYVFGYGSGTDFVFNSASDSAQTTDRILLTSGVDPSDVELSVVTVDHRGMTIPASLLLTLRSTGETLMVRENFESSMGPSQSPIDFIEFADGTVWNKSDIRLLSGYGPLVLTGTTGDDVLLGGEDDEVIDGGAGNDILAGNGGSDTYVFGQGSGHDTIHNLEMGGVTSSDRILLKPDVTPSDVELRMVTMDINGNGIPPSLQLRLKSTGETATVIGHFDPMTLGESAITTIEFADGTVWDQAEIESRLDLYTGTDGDDLIMGMDGNDVIDGGAGNDVLAGNGGSDTYVFGQGSGHDTIYNQEMEGMTSSDRILLKPGVTTSDVELRVVTTDINGNGIPPSLQLRLKSTGETATVFGHFDPMVFGEAAITTIEFADGTVWDQTEIERRTHLFEGTDGDDWLIATEGDDVLDGGAGNDQLMGGNGSDTYVFGYGSGHDLILDQEFPGATASDRLLLKPGVTAADVELRVVTDDGNGNSLLPSLQLKLRSTGETVIVMGQFLVDPFGDLGITTIEFADGTVWDQAEIERRTHLFEGTAGDDHIVATDGNDVLDGGAGNDVLQGGLGNDTYVVDSADDQVIEAAGAGTDTVQASVNHVLAANVENLTLTGQTDLSGAGNGLDNVLTGNAGDNILAGLGGHDQLDGGAGDDLLLGGAGQDTLSGGSGTDVLLGGAGNDSYLFGRGDGADTVLDTGGNADVLQFLGGVTADQLWFRRTGLNLEISLIGTDDKVTVAGWYLGARVEEFKTADGKTLQDNHVQSLVQAMAAFAPPAAGQTTLPTDYAATLNPVIAANWQ